MVFLTASKRITSLIGSPLLRFGLAARSSLPLGGGNTSSLPSAPSNHPQASSDTPYLDTALLIPFSQKLLSLTLYDESQRMVSEYYRQQQSQADGSKNGMLESLMTPSSQSQSPPSNDASTIQEISNLRIQAYDNVIRKTLLPNESLSDLQRWMGHLRILKWARAEFLISKYGPMVKEAMDAYPQLRGSPQFQRNPKHNFVLQLARGRLVLPANNDNNDSSKLLLPTTETILKALNMKDWATDKNSQGLYESTIPIRHKIMGGEDDQLPDNSLQDVTTEELLDCLSGGHVQSCGPLNAICEEANLYQLWTKEYVQHLGEYLLQEYSSDNVTIVDIGAGDGLLIRYLQDYMKGRIKKRGGAGRKKNEILPTMVSTDDGSWGIFAKAKVEKLNVEAALQKYGKKGKDDGILVVLCSWMPQQVDWTAQFRNAHADEYILIGEADDGSCGHGWETWGNPAFETEKNAIPPFEQDGYRRWDMDSLVPFQFSRFDSALSRSSRTVSFRRYRPASKGMKR